MRPNEKCSTSVPTTRDALRLPASFAAELPSGMVEAAIFVILIEDVFEARMALGDTSVDSSRKMLCFNGRFSETACYRVGQFD